MVAKKKAWQALFGLAWLLCLPAGSMAGELMHGEWLVSTTVQIPGMGSMPGGTHRQCYDDLDSPYPARSGEHCHLVSMQRHANTVQWHVRCQTPSGESEIQGETTRSGDHMHGSMHVSSADGAMDVSMEGRYLGPCSRP